MDLHEWITQRVEAVGHLAREAKDGFWAATESGSGTAATVLRRCEADRRVLARHRQDMTWYYSPACDGCGRTGDMDDAATEDINECPELLDLAHAHGITEAELAALDVPQTPPRPPSRPIFVMARMTAEQVPASLRGER